MKKGIIYFLLVLVSISSFTQQTNPSQTLTKQDYLKKSRHQKTVAGLLLGGGTTLVLTGIIIPKGELVHEGFLSNDYENNGIKNIFKLTGFLSIVGSIPMFIASSKNKKKAMSVSLKNQSVPQLQKNNIVYNAIPSLSLKVSL